jgi:enolase
LAVNDGITVVLVTGRLRAFCKIKLSTSWVIKGVNMATLMEKDIVIEAVSGVGALISKKVEVDLDFNEDQKTLHKLHFKLSRQTPEQIDYRATMDYCKGLRAKYEPMPDNQFTQKWAEKYAQNQAVLVT